VALVLAPFVGRAALVEVLGRDLLADEAQLAGFEELVGTRGVKPFECVGEPDECRVAVRMLAADPQWADAPVVRALAAQLAGVDVPSAGEVLALAVAPDFPARFEEPLRAALRA
jgi:hypothetical protein